MLDFLKPDFLSKAYCLSKKIQTKTFFETWEKGNRQEKANIEKICTQNCEITSECLSYGISTKSSGLFGGIYLEKGRPLRGRGNRRGYLEDKRDQRASIDQVA